MNIYTLETVSHDYYELVDLKATSVSIHVIIDEMKRLEKVKCTCAYYSVSIYDGFTGNCCVTQPFRKRHTYDYKRFN